VAETLLGVAKGVFAMTLPEGGKGIDTTDHERADIYAYFSDGH